MLNSNQRGATQLLVILLLLVGLVAGVYLVQHPQIFSPKAAQEGTRIEFSGPSVSGNTTSSRNVTLGIHTTILSIPPLPTGLTVSCSSSGTIASLDWDDSTGATAYAVRVDTGDDSSPNFTCASPDICNDSLASSNFSFTSTPETTYGWWVHAINAAGWSAPSYGSALTCTPLPPPTVQTVCTCNHPGGIAPNNDFSCQGLENITLRYCASNEKCTSLAIRPAWPCEVIAMPPPPPPSPPPLEPSLILQQTPTFTRQWSVNWEKLVVGSYNIHFEYGSDSINGGPVNIPPDTIVQMKPNTTTIVVADLTKGTVNTQYSDVNTAQTDSFLRVETNPAVSADITVSPASVLGELTGIYPTYFRVANCDGATLDDACQANLRAEQSRLWSAEAMEIPWQLDGTNGEKYVFAQFSFDGENWPETVSASITLSISPLTGEPPPPVSSKLEFGLNTHLTTGSWSYTNLNLAAFKADVDDIKNNGLQWIRFNVIAGEVAPSGSLNGTIYWDEGQANLRVYDEAINYAKEKGLKVYLVLNDMPDFSRDYPPDSYQKVARNYADFLSLKWRGKINVWQIFNEITIEELETKVHSYEAQYDAIKGNDPSTLITSNVVGVGPFDQNTLVHAYRFYDLISSKVDVLSFDLYPRLDTPEDTSNWSNFLNRMAEFKVHYQKDIIVPEMGSCNNREAQSSYFPKIIPTLKSSVASAVILYEIRDETGEGRGYGCEESFGLKTGDGQKKEVFNKVIQLIQGTPASQASQSWADQVTTLYRNYLHRDPYPGEIEANYPEGYQGGIAAVETQMQRDTSQSTTQSFIQNAVGTVIQSIQSILPFK